MILDSSRPIAGGQLWGPLVDERDVRHLWNSHLFSHRRLICEDGSVLVVEFPGIANGEAGPDFLEARVWIDGKLRTGDVEVHLHSSGWEGHHHAESARYGQVVLHVALWRDREVPFRQGFGPGLRPRAIPELVLEGYLAQSPWELKQRQWAAPDVPPAADRVEWSARLDRLGWIRFEHKAANYKYLLSHLPEDEVVYRGVMTALGYKRNKAHFYELARRLPWARVRKEVLGRDDPYRDMGSLLERSSGLMPSVMDAPHLGWRMGRQRPANHPLRRLYAIVPFLARALERGPGVLVVEPFREEFRRGWNDGTDHRLWTRWKDLLHPEPHLQLPGSLGVERIDQIIANVFLPFAYVCGSASEERSSRKAFFERLLSDHPALADHAQTRAVSSVVPGGMPAVRSLRRHFGLIQLRKSGPKPPFF